MIVGKSDDWYVPLSDRLASYYRHVVAVHIDDPAVGACLVCRVTHCEDWRFASERLFGVIERQTEPATVAPAQRRHESDQS